ncbi:hypothetical protein [Micromonospora sp. WMMD736]|uniref:hypothetical protein n=1 Tax=Micromonospora sp. WMMD736 TaxID=3404112 RepID=UPI003B94567D
MTALANVDPNITPAFASDAGCWIDGHWGQYATVRLMSLAVERGWRLSDEDDAIFLRLHVSAGSPSSPEASDGDWEALYEQGGLADQAEAWLNDHVAPEGFVFGWHDGEFFLWPVHVWHWQGDDPDACDCTCSQMSAAWAYL